MGSVCQFETKFKASGLYKSVRKAGCVNAAKLIVERLLNKKQNPKILIPEDTLVLNPAFFIICVMDISPIEAFADLNIAGLGQYDILEEVRKRRTNLRELGLECGKIPLSALLRLQSNLKPDILQNNCFTICFDETSSPEEGQFPSINCTAGRLNQAREESLVFATSGANTNSGLEAQPTSAEAETLLNNNNIPQFNATQTTNYGLTNQSADEVSPARDSGSPHDQISPLFTPSSFVGTNADAERGPEASSRLPSDEMSVQNAIEHSFPSHEDTATQTGSSGETGRGMDYVPFQGITTNFDDSTTEVDNSSRLVTSDCPDAADSHKQRGFLPPIKQLLHIADNQGQEPHNLLFSGLRVENSTMPAEKCCCGAYSSASAEFY
ncbi:unnamed protein product [Clonostachys rhizophaga]|uniref:Uncharacterized protein n=1 Tax=Clonostachys rhizophaga TaxID=160324 RepID=A0A9N9V8M7_9HYPO|nr:unnamed protein product [Clonostachys rhizophaga]